MKLKLVQAAIHPNEDRPGTMYSAPTERFGNITNRDKTSCRRLSQVELQSARFVPFRNERDSLGKLIKSEPSGKHLRSATSSNFAFTSRDFNVSKGTKIDTHRTLAIFKDLANSSTKQPKALTNLLFLEPDPTVRESVRKSGAFTARDEADLEFQSFQVNKQFHEYYEQSNINLINEFTIKWKMQHNDPLSHRRALSSSSAFRNVNRESLSRIANKELHNKPKMTQYDTTCYEKLKPRYPVIKIPSVGRRELTSSQSGRNLTRNIDFLHDETQSRWRVAGKHENIPDISKQTTRVDLQQPNKYVHKIETRRKPPVDIEELKKEMQFVKYLQEKYESKGISIPLSFQVQEKTIPLTEQEFEEKRQTVISRHDVKSSNKRSRPRSKPVY